MIRVYEYINYKKYVEKWLEHQPKRGHGFYAKIAEALGISAVLVSQIFSGSKNLSLEHGLLLADFLSLSLDEKNYFLLLVNYERAGTQRLQQHLLSEIKKIQKEKTENLKEVVTTDIQLSEADKATFYSSWLYSAIRLQTSIDGFQTVDALAQRFQITKEEVLSKLQFLLQKNLCRLGADGYRMGSLRTHLESTSPYVRARQISWRVKGFERMESSKDSQLFYTAPMSISENDLKAVRKKITEFISELNANMVQEQPEKLACLNIDLFEI